MQAAEFALPCTHTYIHAIRVHTHTHACRLVGPADRGGACIVAAHPTCVHLFLAAVLAASSFSVGVTPWRRRLMLQQGPSPMWGGAQSMQLVSKNGSTGASGPYLCVLARVSVCRCVCAY